MRRRPIPVAGTYTISLRIATNKTDVATLVLNVGAPGVPGTGVGQRALSLMSPFPVVRIAGQFSRRGARIRRLTIDAPPGTGVKVRCGGRGCPFKRLLPYHLPARAGQPGLPPNAAAADPQPGGPAAAARRQAEAVRHASRCGREVHALRDPPAQVPHAAPTCAWCPGAAARSPAPRGDRPEPRLKRAPGPRKGGQPGHRRSSGARFLSMHRAERMRSRAGTSRRRLLRCLTVLAAMAALALPAPAAREPRLRAAVGLLRHGPGPVQRPGRPRHRPPRQRLRGRLREPPGPEVQPRRRAARPVGLLRDRERARSADIRWTWPWTARQRLRRRPGQQPRPEVRRGRQLRSSLWAVATAPAPAVRSPDAVATDSAGNVYVADQGNNRVQKFNSAGGTASGAASAGTGDGEFNTPAGVEVERRRHRVRRPTTATTGCSSGPTGAFQRPLEAPQGTGATRSSTARSRLTVSGDGAVFVADNANNRVDAVQRRPAASRPSGTRPDRATASSATPRASPRARSTRSSSPTTEQPRAEVRRADLRLRRAHERHAARVRGRGRRRERGRDPRRRAPTTRSPTPGTRSGRRRMVGSARAHARPTARSPRSGSRRWTWHDPSMIAYATTAVIDGVRDRHAHRRRRRRHAHRRPRRRHAHRRRRHRHRLLFRRRHRRHRQPRRRHRDRRRHAHGIENATGSPQADTLSVTRARTRSRVAAVATPSATRPAAPV